VSAFRHVLVIDPKHAESYNYIGYMYAERGQNLTEAVQLIKRALDLDPQNGYFIDSLGWAYYQQGRYAEALTELQRAVGLAKEDPVILDHLADAFIKNGRTDDAIATWERALKADKPDTEAAVYDSVKKKLGEAQEKVRRSKGGDRPKAEQK
jgi:tetratricopeptide (TPR) repeat protein